MATGAPPLGLRGIGGGAGGRAFASLEGVPLKVKGPGANA